MPTPHRVGFLEERALTPDAVGTGEALLTHQTYDAQPVDSPNRGPVPLWCLTT
jgi:hypothetical protein